MTDTDTYKCVLLYLFFHTLCHLKSLICDTAQSLVLKMKKTLTIIGGGQHRFAAVLNRLPRTNRN